MPNRIKWIERTWEFTFPVDLYPEMLERYRGTPARIEHKVSTYPPAILTRRDENTWSIQENIGHLLDLEALSAKRLDEYERNVAILSAADMGNRQTNKARHNERAIKEIVERFREERLELVERLESLPPDRFARSAIHPRLKMPMRLVDFIYFQAEHDDYHLTRMSELARLFAS